MEAERGKAGAFDSIGGSILGTVGSFLLEARSRRQGGLLVHRANGDDNPRTDHGPQAVSGGLEGAFQRPEDMGRRSRAVLGRQREAHNRREDYTIPRTLR